MPWKVSQIVNERMRFIVRLNSGEKMTDLCQEFGISRKTGYKFLERFKQQGPSGLLDESRKPNSSPQQTPERIRAMIISLKKQKPHWGATKVRAFLLQQHPKLEFPSRFTVQTILSKEGLVSAGYKKRDRSLAARCFQRNLAQSKNPNDVWSADFKGQFKLQNGKYCYPLTISDHFSRYLLACEGLENVQGEGAKSVFRMIFQEYGLPIAIRTDNGAPFASGGLFGLSQLSVWWLRLGIQLQRIEPGHPEQNGRHERMHLTLKQETTRPAGQNFLVQQERFDEFREEYNQQRPHEALKLKRPKDFYQKSKRALQKELPQLSYPTHDLSAEVHPNGAITIKRTNIRFHLSTAFSGQCVGLREEDSERWKVSFMNLDLGVYDHRQGKFIPGDRPVASDS